MSLQGTDSCIWPSIRPGADTAEVEAALSCQPAPPENCIGTDRAQSNRNGKQESDKTGGIVTDRKLPSAPFGIKCSRVGQADHRLYDADASDEVLIKYVALGDKTAMRAIFVRYHKRLFRFILRMIHDRENAEDIVSQVFLDVWSFADRFEYRARVSTWLLSIARFKAINFVRRRTHERIEHIDFAGAADAGDTPEAATNRGEVSRILHICLEELSPAHRHVIELFYYYDYSVADLSKMIGIPQSTVKSRLFYARKHLAQILTRVGLEANSIRPSFSGQADGAPFTVLNRGFSID